MKSIFLCEEKKKQIAWFLLITFFIQIFTPKGALALGDGPTQPEVQSFEPVGTSQMVDLSSGTFNYNIPLMQVDGYPINIFYHSGITMDQEASCVGLGWNINPGCINRTMRGLPDDFSGDKITKEMSMKKDITLGIKGGVAFELFGYDKLKLGADGGWFYNNNRGLGMEFGLSANLNITSKAQDKKSIGLGTSINVNLNSQEGVSCDLGLSPIMSYNSSVTHKTDITQTGIKGGLGFNSRTGLKQATLSIDFRPYTPKSGSGFIDNLPLVGRAQYSFAVPSYAPSMDFPRKSFAVSMKGSLGTEIWGIHPGARVTAYYSQLSLKDEIFTSNAYGTLYLERGTSGTSVLDFNREKDGPYTPYLHNLSILVPTPDVYTVSGQGIGGSYLLKRGDCGVFHDRHIASGSESANVSLEYGGGNIFKAGIDLMVIDNQNIIDKWTTNNALNEAFYFKGKDILEPRYEPVYFKQAGELTAESDIELLHNLQDFDPISPIIDGSEDFNFGTSGVQIRKGVNDDKVNITHDLRTYREKRDKRNQNISYLNAVEATQVGSSEKINSYVLYDKDNAMNESTCEPPINRVGGYRKGHHISEITTLGTDGKRYVYGIPAYNISQEEYQFSIGGNNTPITGMVPYTNNNDDSKNNEAGKDHFFLKETTPAYAHSYLLTSVLSADYVDSDDKRGPSDGDYGNFTSIKYHKLSSDYNWRTPLYDCSAATNNNDPYANYNEGIYSSDQDNKASYVFGKKEYWYVNSIEGKTQIAQFFYSDRKDALQVKDKSGRELNLNNKLQQLDSIRLISKANINHLPIIPIITVVFKYENELCKSIPNTETPVSTGKLTLKKLWFKYGKSQKGELSQYIFTYGNGDFANPSYCQRNVSRWGGFQVSVQSLGDLYPYVNQAKSAQDQYANAWNLTKIELPTGGAIEIDYESNDYAFVQNKPAMEMVEIQGLNNKPEFINSTNKLYDNLTSNNYLIFSLKTQCNNDQDVINNYIKDIIGQNIYFKCLVKLTNTKSELIYGYSKIVKAGRCSDDNNKGYIELKGAEFSDALGGKINPITKAGWQFVRISNPDLMYSIAGLTQDEITSAPGLFQPFLQIGQSIVNMASSLGSFLTGPNSWLYGFKIASQVDLGKCWVRLYEPSGFKLAGGSRVKKITISDNWNKMANYPDGNTYDGTKYGQEFTYTKDITNYTSSGSTETKKISSGVASYEPMVGCDENPFRQPEFYDESHLLAPDNRYYQETPAGESFFPSAQIVYSKVTVKNLKFDAKGQEGQNHYASTGESINEYYTSYDFPTIVKQTRVDKQKKKTSLVFSLLKTKMKDHMAVSQGFYVEVNNMHGQPKSQWVLDENGNKVSGVEYYYNTTGGNLNNKVKVIGTNGNVTDEYLGIDFMAAADARQSKSTTIAPDLQLNIDAFFVAMVPIVAVMPIPSIEREETMFRSMTISKFVQKTGILQKTIAYDASSKISTENLAFDGGTGEVLLSKTSNEFEDPIYNLKLPAHFYYSGMDNAYQNINTEETGNLTNYNLVLDHTEAYKFIYPGDELLMTTTNDLSEIVSGRAWVVGKLPSHTIQICDFAGEAFNLPGTSNHAYTIKIIRSGHRNLASNEIAQYTTKTNPIVNSTLNLNAITASCINSSATEYSDKWEWECKLAFDNEHTIYNPFLRGVAGKWKQKRNFTYLADRSSNFNATVSPVGIKENGPMTNFSSYFVFDDGHFVKNSSLQNWRWFEKIVKVDPNGNVVETVDTLGHYSSQMFNHVTGNTICRSNNSRYCEMLAISYEDGESSYDRCFSCSMLPPSSIWGGELYNAHTGKYCKKCIADTTSLYCASFFGYPITPYNQTTSKDYDNECNVFPLTSPIPTEKDPLLFLPIFHLYKEKKYLCSAWVKIGDDINASLDPNKDPYILCSIYQDPPSNQNQVVKGYPEGPIIDGWRRIMFDFTVLNDNMKYEFSLIKPPTNSQTVYLDDFRIQPNDASMKSYVYNNITNKLISELDENNYATFYEYDAAGHLERIKKETEKGIVTIKEIKANQSELHHIIP